MDNLYFKVCDDGHDSVLYDIYINDEWCGSRRTVQQCETFLKTKEEADQVDIPLHDNHVRMRKFFLTFGEKWWYAVFKEAVKREHNEGPSNSRIQRR
jgi:hypothetical protein